MVTDRKNKRITLGLTLSLTTAVMFTLDAPLAQMQGIAPCPGGLPGQLAAPKPGQPGKKRKVDSCRSRGLGGSNSQVQNQAKNNFCAKTSPVPITIDTFIRLQQAVNAIPLNKLPRGAPQTLPTAQQRKQIQRLTITGNDGKSLTLGEGTVVVFAAFVNGARHSNVCSGEDVNCKDLGCENNDIHIELSDSALQANEAGDPKLKDQKLCSRGVVVEISPHFRPAEWENFDSDDYRNDFATHPIRFKGQLFFDASHPPCDPQKPVEPIRVSIWEIHPVYAIDVCKKNSLADCQVDNESVWEPFAQTLGKKSVKPGTSCQPCHQATKAVSH